MTIDILICTTDEGIDSIGEVLMASMPWVHYIVSAQHARPLSTMGPEWDAAVAALLRRPDVTLVTQEGRGLSRNRNNALQHSEADVVVIADDDCRYTQETIERISEAYRQHPEADAICFASADYDGRPFKSYPNETLSYGEACRRGYYPTSFELTLRRESLEREGLLFDEHFGLGAELPAGEEEVFLADAERAGWRVLFVPECIVLTDPATTGSRFLADSRLQCAKGAVFRRRFGMGGALWRTFKEAAHHLVFNRVNPLPIALNMLRGVWTRLR